MKRSVLLSILCACFVTACGKLQTGIELNSTPLTLYYLYPTCKNIGTGTEGWYANDTLISQGACSTKILVCEGDGTGTEGWYVYDKGTSVNLYSSSTTSCSSSLSEYTCSNAVMPSGWYRGTQYIGPNATAGCSTDLLSCYESTGSYTLKASAGSSRVLLANTDCSLLESVYK